MSDEIMSCHDNIMTSSQVRFGQVMPGQDRSSEVRSGQVKSDHDRSGKGHVQSEQSRSGQITDKIDLDRLGYDGI